MARFLVLEVRIVESDDKRNVIASHSEHQEFYPESMFEQKDELIRWAYKGFNLARNGFLGVPEKEE